MTKVTGLNALYHLGYTVVQFKMRLMRSNATYLDLGEPSAMVWAMLQELIRDVPVPMEATKRVAREFSQALDQYKDSLPSKANMQIAGTTDAYRFNDLINRLESMLAQELDMLPIWFVTERRAYSVDDLINTAEKVFGQDVIPLFSAQTIKDIREAGRGIAFELPTAAGFHSVRATEAVARSYYAVIVETRPEDGTPLGPIINGLRTKRDSLLAQHAIDKEDLLHIAIEMLNRLNNVYRKPITHPDMVLDLSSAMNVFDSAKCAIELMLEDAKKKAPALTDGFF